MPFGVAVFDESGNVTLDSTSLSLRLWHEQEVDQSTSVVIYDTPALFSPVVFIYGINTVGIEIPPLWNHRQDQLGRFVGLDLIHSRFSAPSLIIVYGWM